MYEDGYVNFSVNRRFEISNLVNEIIFAVVKTWLEEADNSFPASAVLLIEYESDNMRRTEVVIGTG